MISCDSAAEAFLLAPDDLLGELESLGLLTTFDWHPGHECVFLLCESESCQYWDLVTDTRAVVPSLRNAVQSFSKWLGVPLVKGLSDG